MTAYQALKRSFNRARRKSTIISAAYDVDGHVQILVDGKRSPSVDQVVVEEGLLAAWEHLLQAGCAYGAVSDRLVREVVY